jgi:uncharacterized protein
MHIAIRTDPMHPTLPLFTTTLLRTLDAAERLLQRAAHFAYSTGRSEASLLQHRLAPDMFNLAQHLVVLCDSLQGAAALLVGETQEPHTAHVFNRGSEELLAASSGAVDVAHISTHLAHVQQARARCAAWLAQPSTAPDSVTVARPGHVRRFETQAFMWHHVMPNAHFHVTVAYAILRAAGVPLGKADYEGPAVYALV